MSQNIVTFMYMKMYLGGCAMKKRIFTIIPLLLLLAACNNEPVETQASFGNTISEFEVTNQNDETVTEDDITGKVWVANFIFTNCTTVCPPMSLNMTEIAQELDEAGVEEYGMLSFTVDPQRDDVETLTDYIQYYEIPEDTEWHFVTGYDDEFIRKFAETNFKTLVIPPPEGSDQYTHGTAFYLINKEGKIMKQYAGVDVGDSRFPLKEIVTDVTKLANVN